MGTSRCLIADQYPMVRLGARGVLERAGLDVIEVGSALELERLDSPYFDLALVDVELPPEDGICVIERIIALNPRARVVAWGDDVTREMLLAAIRAGAIGFLKRDVSAEGLIRALEGIDRGEAPLSRQVAAGLIAAIAAHEARRTHDARFGTLSKREREVLELIAMGRRNREIGRALAISEFTVKRHVQNILHKLDLSSRQAAAVFYVSASRTDAIPALGGGYEENDRVVITAANPAVA
jgi:DNA-binding NarL/FixJ family response regulator